VRSGLAFVLPRIEGGGGLDRIVAELAGQLHALGEHVDVVRVDTRYRDPARLPAGVGDVDLRAGRASRALPGLVRYLRRTRPRAVVAAAPMGNLLAAAAVRVARSDAALVLCTQNDFTTLLGLANHPKHRATLALLRRWYPTADAHVTVSHGLAHSLAELSGVPLAGIEVIRNPVLSPAFHEHAALATDHPWFADDRPPDHPPVVISVARLSPLKDLPTLIAAFDELRSRRPARLAILGDGPDRDVLERLVAERGLGEVVWLPGFVDAPQRYVARADVFALSSRSEGLGNVLVEALAVGTPVVATDAPHGPREILRDGQLGRLVPVGDVPALAAALERTLAAPPAPAPPTALEEYDAAAVARRYLEVIDRAAERR
jgi:glycosyltransferase involved in cell wall biosynthesis